MPCKENVERSFSLIRCSYESDNGGEILEKGTTSLSVHRLDAGLVRHRAVAAQVRRLNEFKERLNHNGFSNLIINARCLLNHRLNCIDRLESRFVSTLNQFSCPPRLVPANMADFGDY